MRQKSAGRNRILRASGFLAACLLLNVGSCLASPSEDKRTLGDKLLAAGDATAALPFYDQAIKLNNANWKAYVHRGDALAKMGESHWANEDWKKALQVYPGCPDALARLHRGAHKSSAKHH